MEKRQIRLAIRDFVESIFMEGDLVAAASPLRAVEGTRAHKAIQANRGERYSAEVSVSFTIAGEYTELSLFGRIDGLMQDDDGVTIEEIKSVRGHTPRDGFDGLEVHWAQAKAYAAIYVRDKGLSAIAVQLVYYDIPHAREHRYERRFSAAELLDWLTGLCTRYVQWADREEQRLMEMSRAISALGFPYETVRPGQQEMMAAVYQHVKSGDCLYVSAPTGTGKTMGALFPAIKALADGHCRKLFYLTARNPVKAVAEEAFKALLGRGFALRGITMTAKDRLCPMPEGTPCHPEHCPRAAGFYDRLFTALDDVPPVGHMGRKDVEKLAEKHNLCPHELALFIAEICDLVICDYNNAFDPRVKIKRFFERGGDYALLVDEAHNMVDRARDMFSAELAEPALRAFLDSLPLFLEESVLALSDAASAMVEQLTGLRGALEEAQGQEVPLEAVPGELLDAVGRFIGEAEPLLADQADRGLGEEFLNLYFMAKVFIDVAEEMDQRYRVILGMTQEGLVLQLRCIDPSELLKLALRKVRCAIFFSATLTPFPYYSRLTGTGGDASCLLLPSPFPRENLRVIALDVDTTYNRREGTLPRLVESLTAFVRGRVGNYLLFFPSYSYMRKAHEQFTARNPGVFAPMQASGMSERDRAAFLRHFDGEHDGGMAAFAVMGGIFGEGIDLAGDRVIGVAIVGVGMPQLCLERNLIQQYHDGQEEPGYEFAYVIPGFNRVMQAVGRLIRNETDQGVVLLADRRFSWQQYRQMIPQWWTPMLSARNTADVERSVKEFWEEAALFDVDND